MATSPERLLSVFESGKRSFVSALSDSTEESVLKSEAKILLANYLRGNKILPDEARGAGFMARVLAWVDEKLQENLLKDLGRDFDDGIKDDPTVETGSARESRRRRRERRKKEEEKAVDAPKPGEPKKEEDIAKELEEVDLTDIETFFNGIPEEFHGHLKIVYTYFNSLKNLREYESNPKFERLADVMRGKIADLLNQLIAFISNQDEILANLMDAGIDSNLAVDIIKNLENLSLKLSKPITEREEIKVGEGDFEFKEPGRDDVAAYKQEWKRLWDLDKDPSKKDFIVLVNQTFVVMEGKIDQHTEQIDFTKDPESIVFRALKALFNDLGYSFSEDNGFKGEDSMLSYLYSYLHNRLALADHAHVHGVSASMYVDFMGTFEKTFPKMGRYVTDFFVGTSYDPEKRKEEAYEHYRVVRALDVLITGYYDETVYNYRQKFNKATDRRDLAEPDGTPIMETKQTIYVARDKDGTFIAQGPKRSDLEKKYPAANIEDKYGGIFVVLDKDGNKVDEGTDIKRLKERYSSSEYRIKTVLEDLSDSDAVEPGFYSFGRGKWMDSSSRYKDKMLKRLVRDFACLKGVKRTVAEDGSILYEYGEPEDRKVMTEDKLKEVVSITVGYHGMTATRAQVFTSRYYAVGKSPNDDANLEMMQKCFPMAKELNLTKERVLEIPYIVLGGDISNEWLADSAIKIGLVKYILDRPKLRKATGINSEADFMEPISSSFNKDGAKMRDIRGLAAIRDLKGHEISEYKTSDLPRFRNILISVYISRLKRDLLKFQFLPYKEDGSQSVMRLSDKYDVLLETEDTVAEYAKGQHDHDDFLAPWVAPPRTFMAEYDDEESLDLSVEDKSKPGLTAGIGRQIHGTLIKEYEAAFPAYEKANSPLPKLTGELKHDVELIADDLMGIMKQTSPLKKDANMIDWIFFYELVQMRITRLIIAHTEKHKVFQKRVRNYDEIILRRKIASQTLIDELHHYIEGSGQAGVGADEMITITDIKGMKRRVTMKEAFLYLIPDENTEHNRKEVVGGFWDNISAIFTAEGYNKNSQIGRARVGIYAGGIEQRSRLLDIQGSPYENALSRYGLLSFLDPDTAPLTNTIMMNDHSSAVKSAKEAQKSEESH
ncbi:MAG: hypothetical protein GW942_00420 [Candidatus Pacebacteria bacterium]|nr:hypothetical protein [Candidatus Paceibacterota bacterium]